MWIPTEAAQEVDACKGSTFQRFNVLGRPHLDLDDFDFDFDTRDKQRVSPKVPCKDKVRHVLFSIRLRKAYVVYCFFCFLLACLACVSTLGRVAKLKVKGQTVWSHRWETWETVLEAVIGVAVCSETLCALWLAGCSAFLSDFWAVFDTVVVALTVVHLALVALRWALVARDVLEVDFIFLAVRFALQPCRLLAAASMLRRVRRMQQNTVDLAFDVLENVSEGTPTPQHNRILTSKLQEAISEHLPPSCSGSQWRLAYASTIKMDSIASAMEAFYRAQQQGLSEGKGPNLILVRTELGDIIGGFSTEAWHPGDGTRSGYRRTSTGFVFCMSAFCGDFIEDSPDFIKTPEYSHHESLRFFHATGEAQVLQWSDRHSLSLGDALTLRNDLQTGSSRPCSRFASPALVSSSGSRTGLESMDLGSMDADEEHFTVQCFECWRIDGNM
jgi:hypothetical protein